MANTSASSPSPDQCAPLPLLLLSAGARICAPERSFAGHSVPQPPSLPLTAALITIGPAHLLLHGRTSCQPCTGLPHAFCALSPDGDCRRYASQWTILLAPGNERRTFPHWRAPSRTLRPLLFPVGSNESQNSALVQERPPDLAVRPVLRPSGIRKGVVLLEERDNIVRFHVSQYWSNTPPSIFKSPTPWATGKASITNFRHEEGREL